MQAVRRARGPPVHAARDVLCTGLHQCARRELCARLGPATGCVREDGGGGGRQPGGDTSGVKFEEGELDGGQV